MAAIDQLTSLANVIQAVQGTESKTKTKGTTSQTTQTNVSDAGVNKLIQDILSGPGGVRSIGGAARASGLYNSSTEDMLLGDLYSRAAVSAELARSPTTVRTSQDLTQITETPGIGLGSIGGAIAGTQALGALFGKPGQEGLLSGAGEAISSLFTGGAAAATPAVTSAAGAAAGATPGAIVNAGVAGTAGGALAGTAASNAAAAGAAGAGAAGGASAGFGANAATAIPLGGSFLSGLLGGKDAATDPMNIGISALAGAAALGPVGLIAAPLAAIAGGFLKDISVICTALTRKGLVSADLHKAGDQYFKTVDGATKLGYWLWGVPIAKRIDAGSVFWTRLALPVVKSYLKFLAGSRTILSIYDNPLGGLAHYLGEPVCKLLGKAVIYYETKIKQYS